MTKALNNFASLRKVLHISVVALAMVSSLGVAVAVSGKPTEGTIAPASFVPQSTSSSQAHAIALVEPVKAQPELLIEAPVVALKPAPPAHRTVKMVVTAYCPCTRCCGPNAQGITASGKRVSYNAGRFVAADRSLPFGTKIVIPGYETGPVEVLDRGGAIKGNRIDVYFPTHQEALEWGRQTLDVKILD